MGWQKGLGNTDGLADGFALGPSVVKETHLHLSLSTDIGPVTLTADPVVFQRELRELYVQVGCPPSLLFFLFHDRTQGLANMAPGALFPTGTLPLSPHLTLGSRSQYFLPPFLSP